MLSIVRQCALAGLSRSSYYYEPLGTETEENLDLMRAIDRLYLMRPFYGAPRMTDWLRELGHRINHKRVERLMRVMGLQATLPGPHTSRGHPEHGIYPYLLRDLTVERPNQVWCADITCVEMRRGFLYLVAVLDWFSRYVLAWELSNTLEATFCVEALERALVQGHPDIFNTDQGGPIYWRAVHGVLGAGRGADQYGWPRTSVGQRNGGATVAHGEVRRHLSAGLRRRCRGTLEVGPVFPVLQHPTTASGAWQADPCRGALWVKEGGC